MLFATTNDVLSVYFFFIKKYSSKQHVIAPLDNTKITSPRARTWA